MKQDELTMLIDKAVQGEKEALEAIIVSVQDMVYNLALRILGTNYDAEDATQEILIKVITKLSTFKKESAFSTWVYRVAINSLINYKKSFFSKNPLSFEIYAKDIDQGFIPNAEYLTEGVENEILAEELKQSCTNVMLQCLDVESRMIYVLGVMFRIDSKICGELFNITPEAYRQKLSRTKKRVGEFLSSYCGLSTTGKCNCAKRVGYAVQSKRLDPKNLEYSNLEKIDKVIADKVINAMEEMDQLSLIFAQLPHYKSPELVKNFVKKLVNLKQMQLIKNEA